MAGKLKSIVRAAPNGGINTEVSPVEIDSSFAFYIRNFYYCDGRLLMRSGCSDTGTAAIGGTVSIFRLYSHVTTGGITQYIATGNNKFYGNIGGTPATDITGTTTPTNSEWFTVFIGGTTVFFNGANTPQKYSSGTISDASYTGSSLTVANLQMATNYRDRIYILEKANWTLWYGASNAVTGALTAYDLSYVFRGGGYPIFISTWSTDDGGGLDDRLVIGSSEGEVVVYAGSYPGGQDWYKVAQFKFSPILYRQATFNLSGDLCIMTTKDIVPLKSAMTQGSSNYVPLTEKIGSLYRQTIAGGLTIRPKAVINSTYKSLILNFGGHNTQLVMNLISGAWTTFNIKALDIENSYISTGGNKFAVLESGIYDPASDGDLDENVLGEIYFPTITFQGTKKLKYIKLYYYGKPSPIATATFNLDFRVSKNFDVATYLNDASLLENRTISDFNTWERSTIWGANGYGSAFGLYLKNMKWVGLDSSPTPLYVNAYEIQYEDMGGL